MSAPQSGAPKSSGRASIGPHSISQRDRLTQLRRRIGELDELRQRRPLTTDEQAEADRLTHRHYMRQWRAQQAERWGISRGASR